MTSFSCKEDLAIFLVERGLAKNCVVADADDVDRDEFWGENPAEFFTDTKKVVDSTSLSNGTKQLVLPRDAQFQLMFDGMEKW